jgi:hypothetical protein
MKTLSVSLFNRVDYTRTVLNSLNNCFDIDNYKIFICCEPGNEEVISLAQNFRPTQTTVIVNPTRLGCNKNIYQCWNIGFENNDFHIHIEDDTVPAKDFLLYCEYCRHAYKNNHEVFSISGYVNSNNTIEQFVPQNNYYSLISKRNWFTPWGWATWSDRWLDIKIGFEQISNSTTVSWDVLVHKILKHRVEIFPMVSRIQNIGAENGSFCPGSEWHQKNQYNEYWIENSKIYAESFQECSINVSRE